jgi:hypothetical protein
MPYKRKKVKTSATYKRKGKEIIKALAHGRPGEYVAKAHNELAKRFMLLGCTEEEVAVHLGITHHVFIEWKNRYPSFAQAIIDGGEKADARIADTLYKRANGDIKVNGKQIAPDVRALEIWLRNRQRKRWTKPTEEEETQQPAVPIVTPIVNINQIDFSKLTTEQLEQLATILAAGAAPSGE